MATQHPIPHFVASCRRIFLLSVLLLIVAACETNTPAKPEPASFNKTGPEPIEELSGAFQDGCVKGLEDDPPSDLIRGLSQNDMTVEKLCECQAQAFFETLTLKEQKQMIREYDWSTTFNAGWLFSHNRSLHRLPPDVGWDFQCTPYFAGPELMESIVRLQQEGCMEQYEAQSSSIQDKFSRALSHNNMTVDDFCECRAQTIFGTLTPEETNQLIRDFERLGKAFEHEPWKTRRDRAEAQCVARRWQN